jgi:DnaK suppressor protein
MNIRRSPVNLQQARQRLVEARAEIEARLARTHKHIHRAVAVSANSHEQAVERGNDAVVESLEQEALRELRQIDKALARIAGGAYLNCGKCGKEIDANRLQALPWTEFCIDCA